MIETNCNCLPLVVIIPLLFVAFTLGAASTLFVQRDLKECYDEPDPKDWELPEETRLDLFAPESLTDSDQE